MSSRIQKIAFRSIGKKFLVLEVLGMNLGVEIKFTIRKELKGFYLNFLKKLFPSFFSLFIHRNWNDEDTGTTKRNWRWSESPEIELVRKSRDRSSTRRSSNRDGSRDRNKKMSSSRRTDREERTQSDYKRREKSRSSDRSSRYIKDKGVFRSKK